MICNHTWCEKMYSLFCTQLDVTARPRGDVWPSGLLDVTTCRSMDYIQCLYTAEYRNLSKLRISHLSTQVILLISTCNNNKNLRIAAYEEHRSVPIFFLFGCHVPIKMFFWITFFHFCEHSIFLIPLGMDIECNKINHYQVMLLLLCLLLLWQLFAIDICIWIIDDPDIRMCWWN